MMKVAFQFAAITVLCAAVVPTDRAAAALITYDVAGTFLDGKVLSGSFVVDDSKVRTAQFGPSTISISTLGVLSTFQGLGIQNGSMGSIYSVQFGSPAGYVSISFRAEFGADAKLIALTSNDIFFAAYGTSPSSFTRLREGTITLATAVPEPAGWAMMIAGFGVVGYSMRRQQARVAFS